MSVSPPLSWTTPANTAPQIATVMAGTLTVTLVQGGTATSIAEATTNAQEDVQDAVVS